jgi:hypothetical protein
MSRAFSGPGTTVSESAAARLDAVAEVIAHAEPDWKTLRALYEDDVELRVPPVVLSHGPRGDREVAVPV